MERRALLSMASATAALAALHPRTKRQRVKARTRKNPVSKYTLTLRQHPQTTQSYTFHAHVQIMENGLAPRPHR